MCCHCKVSILHGKGPGQYLKDSNQSSIVEVHMPLLSFSRTMADIINQSCHFFPAKLICSLLLHTFEEGYHQRWNVSGEVICYSGLRFLL